MKVERDTSFRPITITLETEEEAIAMWHLFNMSYKSLEPYVRDRRKTHKNSTLVPEDLKINMAWCTLDEVFTTPESKL
jgi:hypothetical protein